MPVQFIIGRAGSGKTALCTQRTVAACKVDPMGEPIIWLVPRQATFQIERDLCCGTELGGFFRVSVVSFELLCRQVLAEAGNAAWPMVTAQGRQLILGYLLRKHQAELKFFRGGLSHGGLAGEIGQALDELERGGGDLAHLTAQLPDPANTALAEKIHDLELIYRAYGVFLGQQRLDPNRQLQQAMDAFEQSRIVRGATIFVDGFLHFTQRERRLLAALGRVGRSVHITLTMDPKSPLLGDPHQMPDELGLFHAMEMEYRKLYFAFAEANISMEKPLLLAGTRRFQSCGLAAVEQWTSKRDSTDGIELVEAPDKRCEVETAARRVRDWVAGGGRYRDIVVLARDLAVYHDLIAAAFSEHDIPYFADQRRSSSHHPLIQFLRAAVSIAIGPWSHDAMMTIIKSGLCGLTPAEADALENYVLLHGLRGPAWISSHAWTDNGMLSGVAEKSVEELRRRVVEPLRPLAQGFIAEQTVRSRATAIFALLESLHIRRTLSQWIASSPPQQAAEHQQVWAELVELFTQLVDLLGDQPTSAADFQTLLDAALEQFDLAIAPPTVDQVLVGQVDRTRPPAVKLAIILGLSDGQFPRPPQPATILSDADRNSLAGLVDVEPDTRRRMLDEEFLGYFAFTRPSHRLILTRSASDQSGKVLAASSLWHKALTLTSAEPVGLQRGQSEISTPRQLLSRLMQWARNSSSDATMSALYQWLTQRPAAVERMLCLAWPALSYTNKAELSRDAAVRLFPTPLRASVRQLETFRACPFQHFARYGLGLRPRAIAQVTGGDISRFCHELLDRLLRDLLAQKTDWCRQSKPRLQEMLHDLVEELGSQLQRQGMMDSARHRYLVNWIETTLWRVVSAQRTAGLRGQFRPVAARVRFGDGQKLPALRIGDNLQVDGQIDRVDSTADGKAAVVHQYRLSTSRLSLAETYHGISLQLLADALAWEQGGGALPVAALTAALMRPLRDETPQDAPPPEDEAFDLIEKPRGIIDARFAGSLDDALSPGTASQVVSVYLNREAEFGNLDKTDVADAEQFAALLAHVRALMARFGEQITGGKIDVRPYRLGNMTPCPRCEFRDACRFETSQGYDILNPMSRTQVFEQLTGGIG